MASIREGQGQAVRQSIAIPAPLDFLPGWNLAGECWCFLTQL
jgi:hypothetical protein